MIKTTYNAETVFILNDPPNWRLGYEADFKVDTDAQSSLTQREARRPFSISVATTLRSTRTLRDVALVQFIGAIRQLDEQPVLEPFWPAVSFWSDRASMKITAGLMIAFKKDWSQYEIYVPGAEPGWPAAADLVAPLLRGFLSKRPFKWINTTTSDVQLEFTESSSTALAFDQDADVDGPTPAGYGVAPKLVPVQQDHRATSDEFRVVVGREQIGFNRQQETTFYPHDVFRGQSSQYVIRGQQEIANFIAFFMNHSGTGDSFWGRSGFSAATLSANALSTDATINVVDASALRGGDWLSAIVSGQTYFAQVLSVVGNVVTLHAAFGIALLSGFPLFPMSLVKLSSSSVTVRFAAPSLAIAKLTWSEVRSEATLPGDETIGETIGRLPTRVVLIHLFRDYRNGTIKHWYFTSFEQDITWGGHTWTSAPFSVGDMVKTLNVEDDSVDLTSFIFSGNPLNDDLALSAEAPMRVEITFGDLSI